MLWVGDRHTSLAGINAEGFEQEMTSLTPDYCYQKLGFHVRHDVISCSKHIDSWQLVQVAKAPTNMYDCTLPVFMAWVAHEKIFTEYLLLAVLHIITRMSNCNQYGPPPSCCS